MMIILPYRNLDTPFWTLTSSWKQTIIMTPHLSVTERKGLRQTYSWSKDVGDFTFMPAFALGANRSFVQLHRCHSEFTTL